MFDASITIDFCVLTLFPLILIRPSSVFGYFLTFSMYMIRFSVNKYSVTSSFAICMPFISFPYFIKTPRTMLNRSAFYLNLGGKTFTIKCDVSYRDPLYQVVEVSICSLLRVLIFLIYNEWILNFVNAFPASIEMITYFLFLFKSLIRFIFKY